MRAIDDRIWCVTHDKNSNNHNIMYENLEKVKYLS